MSIEFPVDPVNDRAFDQAVWTVARRLEKFSYFQLAADAHVGVKMAAALIARWRAAGAVEGIGIGPLGRKMFSITRAVDETPSRVHRKSALVLPEQAMWIAMRRSGAFTAIDIGALVNTEEQPISVEMVRAYIQTLLAAGYLRVTRKGVHGKVPAAYRLIKDTGPLAPTTRRVTVTVDANLNAVVHVPPVTK